MGVPHALIREEGGKIVLLVVDGLGMSHKCPQGTQGERQDGEMYHPGQDPQIQTRCSAGRIHESIPSAITIGCDTKLGQLVVREPLKKCSGTCNGAEGPYVCRRERRRLSRAQTRFLGHENFSMCAADFAPPAGGQSR